MGSAVDGRVVEVAVEEGDAVRVGQPLVLLRTRTIDAEVASARAELAIQEHELAELENGSRPEEIAQAHAVMLANRARMEYAKKDLNRIQRLYQQATAATDEMDRALSAAATTEQEHLESQAAYELAVAGPRRERIAQARARMDRQQNEVERLEDIRTKYTMVAPFDGYVTAKRTEVGEWVDKGQVVAEVIELKQVDVEAMVPENDVHKIRPGMEAKVIAPSLANQVFSGTVVIIVPQADARSRTFRVKVRVNNSESSGRPVLKGGLFADVLLPVGEPQKVMLVPKDAIVLGGPSPAVVVFEPDMPGGDEGKVRPVNIELGVSEEERVAVRGELSPGDLVVVRGNERLFPDQRVRVGLPLAEQNRQRLGEEQVP